MRTRLQAGRTHARWPRQRGAAAVELALVLPVLLLMSFITTEFGRAIYHYGVLTQSVRQAARFLSMQAPGEGVQTARNLIVYGHPLGSGAAVLPGLNAQMVPEPQWQSWGAAPVVRTVTVRVSGYRFDSLWVPLGGHRWGPITFADISATMRVLP